MLLSKLLELVFLIGSQDVHDLLMALLAVRDIGPNLPDLIFLRIGQAQLGHHLIEALHALGLGGSWACLACGIG